jgi:hypothetical protein
MPREERYTFSQVMGKLVEFESKITNFYKMYADKITSEELRESIATFSKDSERRIELLTRVRQQTIVEMTLEHVTGLKLGEFSIVFEKTVGDRQIDDLRKAFIIEDFMKKTYSEASKKVAYTSADAGELLDRLSQENGERQKVLMTMKS